MPDPSTDVQDKARARSFFRAAHTLLFRASILLVTGLLVSTAFGVFEYYHSAYWNRVGFAPDQPVLFSHRHHAGELRIDCRFCHSTVETSAFAGMPATQTCLNCHSQLFTDTAMLQPVMRSAADREPLAWSRVTALPDHVYFNHSIHVAKGVACTSCHGDVGNMALTAKAKPLDMRGCLDCHRHPQDKLQSKEKIFAAIAATPLKSGDDTALARAWAIHPQHLTNCSTCHH